LFRNRISEIKKEMTVENKVENLRKVMKDNGIDAYIIPTNDPHQSEYVADHWKSREWISGFTGSAGTIVITQNKAGLWTDSRYFLQAELELKDTGISLHKPKNRFAPEHIEWLNKNLPNGSTVGIDGNLCTINQHDRYQKMLGEHDNTLDTRFDLIADVWKNRPEIPTNEIFEHEEKYAGKSRAEKLKNIREKMKAQNAEYHLVTTLDDIAWIYNIRGCDIDFNPVCVCYTLIEEKESFLYINEKKVPDSLKNRLLEDNVSIKPYSGLIADLNNLSQESTLFFDKSKCSVNLYRSINAQKVNGATISTMMKGIKNEIEVQHSREVMAKDGAAIAKTFYWIEQSLKNGDSITEADVADMLAHNRSKMEGYKGESFPAIIGYKGNGAIIHYRPEHNNCATLKPEGILLADSGGQYLNGTTDITRTIALGTPTKEEKRNFTLVLKGNIALNKVTFPQGTTGAQLDILARMNLWNHGLNYGHGTGHGVGFFLNVHEGPQGIAGMNSSNGRTAFQSGMITSNEPGFYKEGSYGIRVENLMVTVPSDHDGFLEFETLTLYPMDIKLIDEAIFSKSEKAWLNKYHYHVLKMVGPYLEGDVKSWFELRCRPMN